MPEYQTTIQDLGAILRGSGKLEFSPYQASPSWTDAGSLSGLEVEESLEVNKEENDNADADELVTKQEVVVKANLHESLRASIWDILRDSFDTKTVTSGALVSGATQTLDANEHSAGPIYLLTGQNGSGAKQTINSVTLDPSGTPVTLTEGDDYAQVKNGAGEWGLVFISGAGYDPTKEIEIDYDYTPAASVKYQSGDQSELPWFMARITTKNDGSAHYFVGYKCKIRAGKKFTFPKDDDTDRRVKVPIEIVCKPDSTYNSGMIYETVQSDGY